MSEALTIGQLAERASVHVETVRFYERRALLDPPPRTAAGHRVYATHAVRRIRFIKQAQQLGFTLDEIRELLVLARDSQTGCAAARAKAGEAIARLDAKVAQLTLMRDALSELAGQCGTNDAGACPLLSRLGFEAPIDDGA
jgi:MerR family mercuric resistance operon transcriptional regulator